MSRLTITGAITRGILTLNICQTVHLRPFLGGGTETTRQSCRARAPTIGRVLPAKPSTRGFQSVHEKEGGYWYRDHPSGVSNAPRVPRIGGLRIGTVDEDGKGTQDRGRGIGAVDGDEKFA